MSVGQNANIARTTETYAAYMSKRIKMKQTNICARKAKNKAKQPQATTHHQSLGPTYNVFGGVCIWKSRTM